MAETRTIQDIIPRVRIVQANGAARSAQPYVMTHINRADDAETALCGASLAPALRPPNQYTPFVPWCQRCRHLFRPEQAAAQGIAWPVTEVI